MELEELLKKARFHEMTEEERDEQVRSFAYGNVHLANQSITREDIDRAADLMKNANPLDAGLKDRIQDLVGDLDVDPAEDLAPTEPPAEDGNFEIECSDFSFVTKNIKMGKALRFTVTWKFDHPRYGLIGASQEGWLATRNYRGQLKVSPPTTKFGPKHSKQLMSITEGFHALILGMVTKGRTSAGLSYADYIGEEIPEELKPKKPSMLDPELPDNVITL